MTGLTLAEVQKQKKLGLTNHSVDSYSPSYAKIIFQNIFSLINIVLTPLMIALALFGLGKEILAFLLFIVINTVVSAIDQIRIKLTLDKLKSQFQQTVNVIRDSEISNIPVAEVVMGDYIIVKEGESIVADGVILKENYLQIDESMLTGESNYIRKDKGEKVLSGSFVVTGECTYKVEGVGNENYLNKLGSEALKYKEKKSSLQVDGDKLITFLVIASIAAGFLNFYATYGIVEQKYSLLSLTTILSLIIPQTLIFLFTLTFTVSITKLYRNGVLVQKGGSIEDLARVDTICFDKTGTITTNEMKIKNVEYFNLDEKKFGEFYNSSISEMVGINKTQEVINGYYSEFPKSEIKNFDQLPFTSKQKFSAIVGNQNNENKKIVLGAMSSIGDLLEDSVKEKVLSFMSKEEESGSRVILGIYFEGDIDLSLENILKAKSSHAVVFSLEETLNPGISKIINDLKSQEIDVKIISGDSKVSVTRVLKKVGIDINEVVDLSEYESIEIFFEKAGDDLKNKMVFTRAKPEDKVKIVKELQKLGKNVAMVGDGINDVLALKAANVSIAMESGAKITRDVSDIVLLNNDYSKIPEIFFEGDNIMFNLKLSTKLFLVKSFFALFFSLFFTARGEILPIYPSSTLIFSFLGTSLPSYIIVFTREKVKNYNSFFKEVLWSSVPVSLLFTALFIFIYNMYQQQGRSNDDMNTSLVMIILSVSIIYTIYLVWKAKKLKNIIVAAIFYLIIVIMGFYQTVLPLNISTKNEQEALNNNLLLGLAAVGAGILYVLINLTFKPKTRKQKIFWLIISFIWIPIVTVFPFRDYYSVTRVPVEMYYYLPVVSLIVILFVVIGGWIGRKVESQK